MENLEEVPNSSLDPGVVRTDARAGGDHPPLSPPRGVVDLPPGIKPFVFDAPKLERFGQKIFNRPQFWPDHFAVPGFLVDYILSPTTIMLEIGDENGLLVVEDVVPNGYATAHIIVFTRRPVPRLDWVLNETAKWIFNTFHPAAISAWIPSPNRAAIALIQRLEGWQFDGQIRKSVVYLGRIVDQMVYSITREDLDDGLQESKG